MSSDKMRTIRAKKLGVLMRNARLASGKEVEECAQAVGILPQAYQEYEIGSQSPSLPELEALAFFLDIPLERFWGQTTFLKPGDGEQNIDVQKVVRLRNRVIGVLIKKYRQEAGMELGVLAEKLEIDHEELEAMEYGQKPVSLPELELIAAALSRPVRDFQDNRGPVGTWANRKRVVDRFVELPPELQEFVCMPVNRPFLELAQRLSEMPVQKLRSVAEGLLEITL